MTSTGHPKRFPISFSKPNRAMALIGISPGNSYVEVGDDTVTVRMGWGFRLDAPRSTVRSVAPDHDPVRAWGAHGWRGRWLVNGSSEGLARLELDPPVRGWVLGFPIKVHTLRVSVTEPDAFVAAVVESG